MDADYNKSQSLIIELEDQCFIGDFKLMSKDRTRIELINVFDNQSGEKVPGVQYFYKSDIKSITIVKKTSTTVNDNEDGISEKSINLNEKKNQHDTETHLTAIELNDIEMLSKNSIYIYKTDRSYHDAIRDMKGQNEIVLNVESCDSGRNAKTTILTICTKQSVYIFDIMLLGRVFPELKEIFESEQPKKIMHDARKITDNLKYRQNVELKGIFDTLCAHVGSGGNKTILGLYDCIRYYFNLPENFFSADKHINWHERPLDDTRKSITAKKSIFIYKLHGYLLHECMLRGFYKTCYKFANVFSSNIDSVEVASDMANNKDSSINYIDNIDLDLRMSLNGIM